MRMRLVLAAVLVVAVLATLAPAATAVPAHQVLIVHGFNATSGVDCHDQVVGTWSEGLRRRGLPRVATVAYYRGDTNCDLEVPGRSDNTINTSVWELGRELAWLVHNTYTRKGVPVAISGHSMGGLVTRAALSGVVQRRPGFPRRLLVSDVVTSGTPHAGTPVAYACGPEPPTECVEMRPGSQFLGDLADNPQGSGATDWTLTGSEQDEAVSIDSAWAMRQLSPGWPTISRVRHTGLTHAQLVTAPVALDRIARGLTTDE